MNELLNSKEESQPKLSLFYRFLCWCSGARLYILEKCPTDYNKFLGIGAVVMLTGLLAFLTGAYALFTVFQEIWISAVLGLFWGVFIFSLDWYIIASLRKEEKFQKELLTTAPRIILAILISVVISKPLELKLFEKEISNKLAIMNQKDKQNYRELIETNFSEIEQLKNENKEYKAQNEQLFRERQQMFNKVIAEAEGRSPTNRIGKGPVYKEKKAEFERLDQEYQRSKERNLQLINENESVINKLENQRNKQLYDEEELFVNTGFLGRIKALNQLVKENKSVKQANWFVILLFVILESSPIFVKLISKRGPYDYLLEALEAERNTYIKQHADYVESKGQQQQKMNQELMDYIYQQKSAGHKNYIDNYFQAKAEIDKQKIRKWEQQRHELLDDETREYNLHPEDVFEDRDEYKE